MSYRNDKVKKEASDKVNIEEEEETGKLRSSQDRDKIEFLSEPSDTEDNQNEERTVGEVRWKFGAENLELTNYDETRDKKVNFERTEGKDMKIPGQETSESITRSPPRNERPHYHRQNSQFMEKVLQKRYEQDPVLNPSRRLLQDVPDVGESHTNSTSSFDVDPLAVMHMIHDSSITPQMESDMKKVAHSARSKKNDRTPHDLFVELDELKDGKWQQQARWIRYEEDLLEGANRWDKPHIPTLTFSSLVSLHLILEECILMLDIPAKNFHSLVFDLVEELGSKNGLSEEVKVEVLRTLLMPHKFVDSQTTKMANIKKTFSQAALGGQSKNLNEARPIDVSNEDPDSVNKQNKENIINRLKKGTEGVSVMVGSLDSLEKPLSAFIRLDPPIIMPNVIEARIPVRFLFILFTPKLSVYMNDHEIGKSFSTLMSNKKFQKVVYRVEERRELFDLIHHFLDETVVVPMEDLEKDYHFNIDKIYDMKHKNSLKRLSLGFNTIEKLWRDTSNHKMKWFEFNNPDNPLVRTNVPFGGVIREIKKRYPLYLSDIADAFSPMCIAAVIFIFFASLAGAIAFGGLLGDKTGGLIGIPETLITTSISGCIFALFSGQPLVIIGVTGPIMVYDEALFKFSKSAEVEFLTWRVWISFWTFLIALVVAGFQGSFVAKFFTKFTKEIFESFIATVFIVEALLKTAAFFSAHPPLELEDYCTRSDISTFLHNTSKLLDQGSHGNVTGFYDVDISSGNFSVNFTNLFYHGNETSVANSTFVPLSPAPYKVEPNTALLSFILQFATFALAYSLRQFINGKALGRRIRHVLSDFAIPIAIVIMVGIGMGFPHIFTQKLNVPSGLDVTSPDKRDWFVSPMGHKQAVPIWIPFISVLPAILLYLLLFMETSICELILMDKVKKGCGLHMDVVLLTLLNVGGALFGGPWICAATVRAITHLNALLVMSTTHAPGESPTLVEVKDQRVTAFFVALLVGLSVLLSSLLRLVPNAVIFGVFLYMGVSSIKNIQFFNRLCLLWIPVKHHPSVSYVRRVPTLKMHLFTFFQCFGLGILWLVKSTPAGLVFPFFVVAMIPLRLLMKFFFTPEELNALDGPKAGRTTSE